MLIVSINPTKLIGDWTEGYALDKHTISSEYVGEDAFGNKQFKTVYSPIGELLYKIKYNGHHDTSENILELAKPFLDEWLKNKNIDIILPVPPTKRRDIQPINIIVETVAKNYNIPYSTEILFKKGTDQSKNMNKEDKNLQGSISLLKNAKRQCNILLVDDLFSTGSTVSECVRVLRTDELVQDIYVLTISKTG